MTEELTWPSSIPVREWTSIWIGEAQEIARSNAPPNTQLYLARLLIECLSSSSREDIDDEQLRSALEIELKLFDIFAGGVRKKRGNRLFSQLLLQFKKLLSSKNSAHILLSVMSILGEPPAQWHLVTLNTVVDCAAEGEVKDAFDTLMDKLVTSYISLAVTPKTGATKAICDKYSSVIAHLGPQHIKLILPEFNKLLKRNPDSVQDAVVHFMENIKLDMSPFLVKDIFPIFSELIQGKEVKHRNMAVRCLSLACKLSADIAVKTELLDQVCKIIGGPVPNPYQRAGLCGALEGLTLPPHNGFGAAQVEKVVGVLVNVVQKEINLDALQDELQALGSWISCSTLFPKTAVALYKNGLNDNKKPEKHKFFLYSLATTIANDLSKEKSAAMDELVETVISVITKAKTRPTLRTEALLALTIATKMSLTFPRWGTLAEKEKIWDSVFSDSSFLFSGEFLPRLEDAAYSHLLKFLELVILNYFPKVESCSPFFGLVVSVMIKGTWATRESSLKVADNCHQKAPKLSGCLLNSFDNYLQKLGTEQSPSSPTPTKAGTSPSPSTSTPSSTSLPLNTITVSLRSALTVIVSKTLPPAQIPQLILLANHPLLLHNDLVQPSLLRLVTKRLGVYFEDIVRQNKTPIISYLYGPQGIEHPTQPNYRQAAMHAICGISLLLKSRELTYDIVFPYDRLLHLDVWFSLSKDEINIYNTPSGVVYGGKDTGPKNKSQELMEKEKAKKEVTDPVEIAKMQKLLAEEKEVRARVKSIYDKIIMYLQGIVLLSQVKPLALGKLLFTVVPKLLNLLKTNEFSNDVERIIKIISENIFYSGQKGVGRSLANAIVLSLCKEPKISPALQISNFSAVVELLRKQKDILTGAQFAMSLPIINNILTSFTEKMSYSGRAQDSALCLLEQHAKVHHSPLMAATALHVIGEGGKLFAPRARKVLKEYASTLYIGDTADVNVILGGLISRHVQVRLCAIQSLCLVKNVEKPGTNPSKLASRVWYSKNDTHAEITRIANELYKQLEHRLGEDYFQELLPVLEVNNQDVRLIAGRAIASGIAIHPQTYVNTLKSLFDYYKSHVPSKDQLKYEQDKVKVWVNQRRGVAVTLAQCAALPTDTEKTPDEKTSKKGQQKSPQPDTKTPTKGYNSASVVKSIFEFLLSSALYDEDEDTYSEFVETGSTIIALQGQYFTMSLFPLFTSFLDRPRPTQPSRDTQVRESVVIFLGALAQHLPKGDKQIVDVTEKLIDVLNTPSEPVRRSIAEILSKLGSIVSQADAERLLQKCFNNAMKAAKPGERRGAAFGFAGLSRALGITHSMQKLHYFDVLKKATEDQDSAATDRHGALCIFDTMSRTFGRLFEPYVVHILSPLLGGFGDKNNLIREATKDAAKTIMGQLSGHCLKLVLPALLKALTDRQWRTKIGSIQLLGSMANCQPKQLSSCLPTIVPELFTVLSDTHPKVQSSAREALRAIGKVIQNPEIRFHVPILLDALDDPTKHSSRALESLLKTHFVHHIDPASLSLIMPILHRALNDRNTDTKVKAATIVGNMCRLTEQRDLLPYLGGLMENIQIVLLDPIPSTRAIASKAVGSLVNGMGEEEFPKLIPWLLETIQSHSGFIERSGAAQGLSAVIAGLPDERFKNDLLPTLLKYTTSEKPLVRQGFLCVFQFLPEAWGMPFSKYLDQVLPAIVRGLADETEIVRDAALKAGQSVVGSYAHAATDLLIPLLENGLFAENWRIRQSSVELLGEFLRQIVVQQGGTLDGPEVKELTKLIGDARGSGILSALYLIRSDPNSLVSGAAITTWKSVVNNTPKTLKDILPTLMDTIVQALASGNSERKTLASLTLGDVVRKLGDRVLSTIIPLLAKRLESDSKEIREGVTIGLSEVLGAAPKHQISEFLSLLVPSIQHALSDSHVSVQEAAAKAFDVLYMQMGNKILDGILQPLIRNLEDSDPDVSKMALNALKQLLAVRSNIVLPSVVPKLVAPPLTLFNAKSLASVAEVSGPALYNYLGTILPAMFEGVYETNSLAPVDEDMIRAVNRIVLAVGDDGCSTLFTLVNDLIKSGDNKKYRLGSCQVAGVCAKESKANILPYLGELLPNVLQLFQDPVELIQKAAVQSLGFLIESIPKEKNSEFISDINNSLDYLTRTVQFSVLKAATVGKSLDNSKPVQRILPGFALPGGVDSLLPLYLNSLRAGSPQGRGQVLDGIRLIVALTPTESLKPHLVQIIGSLIRIFSEKTLTTQIKTSIIQTLNLLIEKGGDGLKVAVAQLQTTYVKAVSDSAKEVRQEAAPGLGKLLNYGARVDFILKELLRILPSTGSQSAGAAGTPVAILTAILSLLDNLNQKTLPKSETALILKTSLFSCLADDDEFVRISSAKCISAFSKLLGVIEGQGSVEEVSEQFFSSLLVGTEDNWRLCHGGLFSIVEICAKNCALLTVPRLQKLKDHLQSLVDSPRAPVRQAVTRVIGAVVNNCETEVLEGLTGGPGALIGILAKFLEDPANDVKVSALQVVKYISKHAHAIIVKYLPQLVPLILTLAKDKKQVRIKFAAERALYHILQYYKDDKLVQRYSKAVDQTKGKDLTEFCKKILAKFEPSDDDGDTGNTYDSGHTSDKKEVEGGYDSS